MARVEILLSTYNGEKYLAGLLESIAGQTFTDWKILARDDGSSDKTVGILERFRREHAGRLMVVDTHCGNLGPAKSFGVLMTESTAPYVMFCDQDDIWLPEKIEATINVMSEQENETSVETPLLVFTDMTIVDEKLNVLHDSFWVFQKINSKAAGSLYFLCFQNPAAGCTVMINRAGIARSLPVKEDAIMHDWWCVLVCGLTGRVVPLHQKTVLYRQHAANVLGAGEKGFVTFNPLVHFCRMFIFPAKTIKGWKHHGERIRQAKSAAKSVGRKIGTGRYFFEIIRNKYLYAFLGFFNRNYRKLLWSKPQMDK